MINIEQHVTVKNNKYKHMKHSIFTLFLFFSSFLFSQSLATGIQSKPIRLTNYAEISVITCGPGNEVYSSFGHSAFRVRDVKLGIDRVYNYGTFDFNTPNFYGKFAQGNSLFLLSSYDFGRFLRSYQRENRWVKAQVLDLNHSDVQACFDFLEHNALPENRAYLYDYFFDNCSTRLYDVMDVVLGEKLILPKLFEQSQATHRSLIQPYLTNQAWGDFGIDIALGSIIDRDVSMKEYLFLPENVFTFFEALKIEENGVIKSIIKRTEEILPENNRSLNTPYLSPFILFSIIGLIIVYITRKDIQKKQRSRWLDFSLFFVIGLIGVILSLIWFATNHVAAANNFNILWAFAPNLIVAFILLKKELPNWIRKYMLLLLILLGVLIVLWLSKFQIFSNAILPILFFLGVRYYYLWKYQK